MPKRLSQFAAVAMFALFVAPSAVVCAQIASPGSGGAGNAGSGGVGNPGPVSVKVTLENPFKLGNSLYDVLKGVVNNVVMPLGGILCVLAFVFAGFKYVTAGGSKTKIEEANRMLLYAAIGTAVLLGAWTIAQLIDTTIHQVIQ